MSLTPATKGKTGSSLMETTAVPCMINVATDVGITGINGDFVININQMSGAY